MTRAPPLPHDKSKIRDSKSMFYLIYSKHETGAETECAKIAEAVTRRHLSVGGRGTLRTVLAPCRGLVGVSEEFFLRLRSQPQRELDLDQTARGGVRMAGSCIGGGGRCAGGCCGGAAQTHAAVCAWYVCGMCVVCVWHVCGMCVVCVWYVCGEVDGVVSCLLSLVSCLALVCSIPMSTREQHLKMTIKK